MFRRNGIYQVPLLICDTARDAVNVENLSVILYYFLEKRRGD